MSSVDGERSGEADGMTESSRGAVARIKALDQISASTIRNTQIITSVSDVVRELVENAIDAGGTSIQIVLMKNGLEKIEVRDNGHGIPADDFQSVFQGGHTSKLKDTQNLSRGEYFGFKGEALRALCASGNVSVLTKTASETAARKYQLNALGGVVKRSHGSHSGGTTVTLEKLFEGIRVRRQRLENKTTATNEIKDIETFLKGVALANPKCHLSFFHNASLVWSKAAVQTVEQAIIAVLGHNIGKRMEKYGPIRVNISEEDSCSNPENENGLERSIELYLPKKPVDMRTISYTSNKLALIFCNKKRVFIREFEKLIHKYTTSSVVKPQPSDQRRFPVSILSINVPPVEADFNREMDKSKVFLVHKEKIYQSIEKALIEFYGVDLKNCDEKAKSKSTSTGITNELSEDMPFEVSLQPDSCPATRPGVVTSAPILSSSSSERCDVIDSFLQDIPRTSKAFSASPSKENVDNMVPISVSFPVSKPAVDKESSDQINKQDPKSTGGDLGVGAEKRRSKQFPISNFQITVDSQDFEEDPVCVQILPERPTEVMQTDGAKSSDIEKGIEKVSANKYQDWLEGRMLDRNGDVIRNVVVVNKPPPSPRESMNLTDEAFAKADRFIGGTGIFSGSKSKGSCHAVGVYSTNPPPVKRQKLLEELIPRHMSPAIINTAMAPPSRLPVVAQSTPDSSHKQVPLDFFPNWKSPISSGFRPVTLAESTELRLPIPPQPQPFKVSVPNPLPSNQLSNTIPLNKPSDDWDRQRVNRSNNLLQKLQPPVPPQSRRLDDPQFPKEQTDATSKASRQYTDWQPYTDYCDKMSNYKLSPVIIGKLPGPVDTGPLFLVRTESGIGAFSAHNAARDKPGKSPSDLTHQIVNSQDQGKADFVGDSGLDITAILQEYLARQSSHSTDTPSKSYHTLLTSTELSEITKKCVLR